MFLITVVFLVTTVSYAQWRDPEASMEGGDVIHSYSDKIPEPGKKVSRKQKKKEYKGFAKLKKDFELLCSFLENDGRRDWFYGELAKHRLSKADCPYCKPFFKLFWKACRPPRKKTKPVKKKSKDESPEEKVEEDKPKLPEREPRLAVLDQASRVFNTLHSDKENLDEIYKVVVYLLEILNNPKEKNAAQREYYSTVATYIFYPFKGYVENRERKARIEERMEKERKRREQFLGDEIGSW